MVPLAARAMPSRQDLTPAWDAWTSGCGSAAVDGGGWGGAGCAGAAAGVIAGAAGAAAAGAGGGWGSFSPEPRPAASARAWADVSARASSLASRRAARLRRADSDPRPARTEGRRRSPRQRPMAQRRRRRKRRRKTRPRLTACRIMLEEAKPSLSAAKSLEPDPKAGSLVLRRREAASKDVPEHAVRRLLEHPSRPFACCKRRLRMRRCF